MRHRRSGICRMRSTVVSLGVALALALLWAGPASAAFGLNGFDVTFTGPNGEAQLQAGSHPYALTTTFNVNTREDPELGPIPEESVKDLFFGQIPGLVGIPKAVPQCKTADFLTQATGRDANGVPFPPEVTECPNSSAVGLTTVTVGNGEAVGPFLAPVYNLEPSPRTAAKLGFVVQSVPVTIDLRVSESAPYNIVAKISNISQVLEFYGDELTVWGNPASPVHDDERARCYEGVGTCPATISEVPFLTMPRSCKGPLSTTYAADSWPRRGSYLANGMPNLSDPLWATGETLSHEDAGTPIGMFGCGKLSFSPEISAAPTSRAAESSSGLDFHLDVANEGLVNAKAEAAGADVEKAIITLPEGMTANPSSANGLGVCTEEQLEREASTSGPGEGCPDASKLGSVEVETQLLPQTIKGGLYLAQPYQNPFHSLLALYMVLQNEELGISIKQPLRVEPDPTTGQLVTVAEGLPQLPFSHFRLHFREGPRSPLVTPPSCGSKPVKALLYPSSGGAPVERTSTFEIITGSGGGPCPSGGTPPFHPGLEAGTINNASGSYSPFDIDLSRTDAEQEITHFSIKLPPGVTGKLAGIPFCGNGEIAAAKARERTPHGGQEEIEHPSCPAASQVGTSLVGAGVGTVLTYVPGKVYLAGPYNGSNLSVVAITAAKAGPFDLGTVVIREALKVNPETAEVSVDAAGSDPIPHIVDGIPVDLRDIRVSVDRPEFTLNPTNCEPTSTASTVLGSGTNFASEADDRPVTVTSRFQAADCASLGFKPNLKISLKGPTKRAGLPALKAVVTPRTGDANIGRAVVILPPSEFLEQAHIGNSCTRVQFNAGGGNGEQCPANSVLGHAKAVTPLLDEPLEGPVFLRSNGGERKLPDLVAALHSTDINIDLVGFISSLHKKGSDVSQIRSTFATVPDQPVTKFTLEMLGGKKGLLVNSTNLCKGTHKAISEFTGQNGKVYDTEPAVQVQCGKKGKKARHSRPAA